VALAVASIAQLATVAESAPLPNLVLTCSDENAIGQDQDACEGIWAYEIPTNDLVVASGNFDVWVRAGDLAGSDTVAICKLPLEPGKYSSCRDETGLRRITYVPKDTVIQRPVKAHKRYVVLQVTEATDALSHYFPAINDRGEIVYLEEGTIPSGESVQRIVSTKRGTLVTSGPRNARFPDINNRGEVVYADLVEGLFGLHIVSTERGPLARGNFPAVDDFGFVAAFGADSDTSITAGPGFGLGIIRPDGTIVEVKPHEFLPAGIPKNRIPIEVRRDRHLYYQEANEVGQQLFSSRYGQLTNFDAGVMSIAVNAIGRYVYNQGDIIYSQRGEILWDGGPIGNFFSLDMNIHGDIVFTETPSPNLSQLFLLTRRPEFYVHRYGFTYKTAPY
jgi:hypothetical protein